ncbi:hypothetical protein [Nocardioides sp. W7]|uniref:hypothetical protein n=1 Tax=Nocardioides sp. W7 TaxID=2931390 RepID=UPI001FD4AD45|nr:hypothetical protein [Nocardioides sp. W7]
MTDLESRIVRELEARADSVSVGPAPVADMVRSAGVRRRRPLVVLAAAAAVAVVVAGVAVVAPSSAPDTAPPVAPTPAETRYVGYGRVQIAVPAGWAEDRPCGPPLEDVVYVGRPNPQLDCFGPRPAGVDSVQVLTDLGRAWPGHVPAAPRQELVIDGVPAWRTPFVTLASGDVPVYGVLVGFPDDGVQLVLESSTGIPTLEKLLAGIRVLSDRPPTKRVGIGHVSVEVPMSWARNVTRCGIPREDTVIDRTAHRACQVPRRPGVESVLPSNVDPRTISSVRYDLHEVEVDGVPVLRSAPVCDEGEPEVCRAAVWVPSERAGILVDSSTDAATVDRLLDTLSIDPTQVAVPPPYRLGDGVSLALAPYLQRLQEVGLAVGVAADGSGGQKVLAVTPEVGTMVPVGSAVRVEMGRGTS